MKLSNLDKIKVLEKLYVIYIILFFIEGAFRKWILPNYSDYFLLCRDPVAILIIFWGFSFIPYYFKKWTFLIKYLLYLFVILGLLQFYNLHFTKLGSIFIIIYGLRSNFLHYPLIPIFIGIITPTYFRKINYLIVLFCVVNLVLMYLQYNSSKDSFINYGQRGISGAQIGFIDDLIRPCGTFSYVIGPMYIMPTCLLLGLYNFIQEKYLDYYTSLLAILTSLLSMFICGSRTLVLINISIIVTSFLFLSSHTKKVFTLLVSTLLTITVCLLYNFNYYLNIKDRFIIANEIETTTYNNSIISRLINIISIPLDEIKNTPILGYGLGMGSNVASEINRGYIDFSLGEYEYERLYNEIGPIFLFILILFRLYLIKILFNRFKLLKYKLSYFYLLILPILLMLFSNTSQTTSLGALIMVNIIIFTLIKFETY